MEKDELIYQFHDTGLLTTAMTHSSYANEHRDQHIQNNERLEFLGDSILGLVSADYVFHRYPHVPEGQLTKLRAAVVDGDMTTGSVMSGQIAGMVHDIKPCKEIVAELVSGFEAACKGLGGTKL